MLELWTTDAIWISVAFVLGMAAKKVNLPPLIGFLAGGFLINFSGFTEGGMALNVVADLGVMLLLFTIGLKLNIKSIFSKEIWLTTTLHMIISVLVLGAIAFIVGLTSALSTGLTLKSAVLIGFALSFSSTVFAVKVLEDRGEISSFHGRVAIGILVMQDLIAVVFLSFSKGTYPSLWVLGLPLYLYLIRWVFIKILNIVDHGELLTLFGFFGAFVAGAIVFELVGLKPDLGALIIGALLGSHPRSKELQKHMMAFKDFFLIAFFLNIGMSDLPTLSTFIIALILMIAIPLKGYLFILILTRLNLRARTAWHVALGLSNYSEFGLITAVIGLNMGLITNEWIIIIALAVSLSFLLTSPVNFKSHALFDKYKDRLIKFNTDKKHPDDEPLDLGDARVVICGMGRIGRAAYHQLSNEFGEKVIGIDYDKDVVSKLNESNKNVVWGDSTDSLFWQNVDMPDVEFVLLTMNDHASNINTANALRNCRHKTFSIASPGHYLEEIKELRDTGVSFVYNYYNRVGAEYATGFMNFVRNREDEKANDLSEIPRHNG